MSNLKKWKTHGSIAATKIKRRVKPQRHGVTEKKYRDCSIPFPLTRKYN